MEKGDKLLALLKTEQLNEDTELYRYSLPEFLNTEEGQLILRANPEATEMVEDFYSSGHIMMAKYFGPGLAFTTGIEEEYRGPDHVLISVHIGDILKQGGKLYPDVSSGTTGSKSFFITLPKGSIAVARVS